MYYREQYEREHASAWRIASNPKRGDSLENKVERAPWSLRVGTPASIVDKTLQLIAYHEPLASIRRVCLPERSTLRKMPLFHSFVPVRVTHKIEIQQNMILKKRCCSSLRESATNGAAISTCYLCHIFRALFRTDALWERQQFVDSAMRMSIELGFEAIHHVLACSLSYCSR